MEIENTLQIDYKKSSLLFERAMKKIQIKKILYKSLFKSRGLEFDGYRYFDSEDDYNSIDWKATLRVGKKMIKQYKEERDVNIYFLVDCGEGMLFGSENKLKAEYVGEIVCVLSHLVLNSGDRAGLIMYSDKEIKLLKPSNNKNQLLIMHKFLSDIKNYRGHFHIDKALEFSFKFIKTQSNNVIFISDFLHLKKDFEKVLSLVSSKADIIPIMVRDKMDEDLPGEKYKLVLQDPNSNKQMIVDSQIARYRFRELVSKQKQKLKNIFTEKGIDFLELQNSEPFTQSLSNFMRGRVEELRI